MPVKKSSDKLRAKQLADLKAAVPSTAPERMRATIRVNPVTVFTNLGEREGDVDITSYSVDMILELSERDRAAILEHHLDKIVMEKVPAYAKGEILNILAAFDEQYSSYSSASRSGLLGRALMDQQRRTFESYQKETKDISIADYMKSPYSRVFDTMPEANDYADKLKEELLPKVKGLLDRNVDRQSTAETVEF